MELLIPGLLLVAFMVWASTRIKKNAAAAFDPETIETDEFSIQKPEGFLHNLNGDPKYIFEAYSKELSKVNDNFRIGTATITKIKNSTLENVVTELLQTDDSVDHGTEIIDEHRYRHIESHKNNDGVETGVSYKLAEKNGNVYKLEIAALKESANDQWIETFFDSFRVK
ncbi:MAG: hypothetical protein IPL32_09570 [Chloracidobacterium sp.]|nr:hypothetical protein [Chloracidobacterium sp.]